MKPIYLNDRFFVYAGSIILLFVVSFVWPSLLIVAKGILGLFAMWVIYDVYLLLEASKSVTVERKVTQRYSLGDEQLIQYELQNNSALHLKLQLIDELPYQLQDRKAQILSDLAPQQEQLLQYKIRPITRGLYSFGETHLFIERDVLGLTQRRLTFGEAVDIRVYPSIIQMKKYDLEVFSQSRSNTGVKHIRKVGQNDEFEHIKQYSIGDHIKSINWRATSRRDNLMVNQYQDTQSQSVYCVIDKGRSMKMPFDGLSLLDHAINSTLVISNIVIKKYDIAGLITIAQKVDQWLKASNHRQQIRVIADALFNQTTSYQETNYEMLYYQVRRQIARRSLLILYTNFEHLYDMRRALPYLRKLNQLHLLVTIIFTNTELVEVAESDAEDYNGIYVKTFAQKNRVDKEKIAEEMRFYGLQVILSRPQDLSINVINKYLEIKAKRMM